MMRHPTWTINCAAVGEYPQNQTMGEEYDYEAENSVRKLWGEIPDTFCPNFRTVVIHGHARLTDLISSTPIPKTGLLISEKLWTVLQRFELPNHRLWSVPMVYRRKSIDGYHWLYLPHPQIDVGPDSSTPLVEQRIRDDSALSRLDLLRLDRPASLSNCFVSDELRRAIESAGITGIRFGTGRLFLH